DGLSIEDLNLPRSIVQRLAKGVLPANTQIQKDALLAMSKSATVFVNYLTNQARENVERAGKKTIQPKDVLQAVTDLEFPGFLERLEAEVEKYTSTLYEKRTSYRAKVREEQKAKKSGDITSSKAVNGDADSPPAAKRAKRSSGGATAAENADTTIVGDEEEENEDADETIGDAHEEQEEEEEEGEDEGEGEGEEEGGEEQLVEDPIEVRDSEGSDDEMNDGDESD
ncbi:histone-fold-containing protein, partial [Delitschia confertaspora ATCC 74209]